MKLFKNVDICDLESILENGVLSLDKCENDNWEEGHRGCNRTDVVYLFSPIKKENSFPRSYGAALLEIEIDDAEENEMAENDRHRSDYIEYIASEVKPEQIKNVYIPQIFRNKLNLPEIVEKKVHWCDISADIYGDSGLEKASDAVLEIFSKTAKIEDSGFYDFFRGTFENMEIFDLYNIIYEF